MVATYGIAAWRTSGTLPKFVDWRRRVRLFHALRLLEEGASVTAAAMKVGYASTSAFSEAFARQFGRSPTGRTRAAPRP